MDPNFTPTNPAPPSTHTYAPSALETLPQFSRDLYRADGYGEAPVLDPTKPYKLWSDQTVLPGDSRTYQVWSDAAGGLVPLGPMSAADAAALNLPGAPQYPAWNVAPTPAIMQASGSPAAPVNAGQLATPAQAAMLAALLGGSVVPDQMSGVTYTWNGETRGLYGISVGGNVLNCGVLLGVLYAQGVGYPGTLSLVNGTPVFTPAPPPTVSTLGTVACPCRPLISGVETVSSLGPMSGWLIVNSNNPAPYTVAPAASGPTGLSATDEATLNRIDANVRAFCNAYNVPGRQ
jgi:hypothetical protein